MKTLLTALGRLFKIGAMVSPVETENAETAYERGDFATALDKFRPRAPDGHPISPTCGHLKFPHLAMALRLVKS